MYTHTTNKYSLQNQRSSILLLVQDIALGTALCVNVLGDISYQQLPHILACTRTHARTHARTHTLNFSMVTSELSPDWNLYGSSASHSQDVYNNYCVIRI